MTTSLARIFPFMRITGKPEPVERNAGRLNDVSLSQEDSLICSSCVIRSVYSIPGPGRKIRDRLPSQFLQKQGE